LKNTLLECKKEEIKKKESQEEDIIIIKKTYKETKLIRRYKKLVNHVLADISILRLKFNNPHGFPSRQTVGKLIELIGSKATTLDLKNFNEF